jgi:hypothetical protein
MTTPQGARTPSRRIILIAAGIVLVLAIIVGILVASLNGRPQATAGATNTFDPSAPFTPSTPTALPTATSTATASAPVAFTAPAPVTQGIVVTVTKIESVTGVATQSGEVAGPSVRFTVVISNSTSSAASLATTVVNAYYGASQKPAIELGKPGGAAFPASVAAGGTAQGVFVFNIPKAQRSNVELTVDYSVTTPTIAFKGAVK